MDKKNTSYRNTMVKTKTKADKVFNEVTSSNLLAENLKSFSNTQFSNEGQQEQKKLENFDPIDKIKLKDKVTEVKYQIRKDLLIISVPDNYTEEEIVTIIKSNEEIFNHLQNINNSFRLYQHQLNIRCTWNRSKQSYVVEEAQKRGVEKEKQNKIYRASDSILTGDHEVIKYTHKYDWGKYKIETSGSIKFKIKNEAEFKGEKSEQTFMPAKPGKGTGIDFVREKKAGEKVKRKKEWGKYSKPLLSEKLGSYEGILGKFDLEYGFGETKIKSTDIGKKRKSSMRADGWDMDLFSVTMKLSNGIILPEHLESDDPIVNTILEEISNNGYTDVVSFIQKGLKVKFDITVKFIVGNKALRDLKDVKSAIKKAEEESDKLKDDLRKTKKDFRKKNEELKEAIKKKREINKEIKDLSNQKNSIRHDLKKLDRKIRRMERNPEKFASELDDLKKKRASLQASIKNIDQKLTDLPSKKIIQKELNQISRQARKTTWKLKELRRKVVQKREEVLKLVFKKIPKKHLLKLLRIVARLNIFLDILDAAITITALIMMMCEDRKIGSGGELEDPYEYLWKKAFEDEKKVVPKEDSQKQESESDESEMTSDQSTNTTSEMSEEEGEDEEQGFSDDSTYEQMEKSVDEIANELSETLNAPKPDMAVQDTTATPISALPNDTTKTQSTETNGESLIEKTKDTIPENSSVKREQENLDSNILTDESNKTIEENSTNKLSNLSNTNTEEVINSQGITRNKNGKPLVLQEVIVRPQKEVNKNGNSNNNLNELQTEDKSEASSTQLTYFEIEEYEGIVPKNPAKDLDITFLFPRISKFKPGEKVNLKLFILKNGKAFNSRLATTIEVTSAYKENSVDKIEFMFTKTIKFEIDNHRYIYEKGTKFSYSKVNMVYY